MIFVQNDTSPLKDVSNVNLEFQYNFFNPTYLDTVSVITNDGRQIVVSIDLGKVLQNIFHYRKIKCENSKWYGKKDKGTAQITVAA